LKYLDTIEIKNFKSIRHQKIEGCKRINLFIGYPNVGKSNILEALGLFSYLKYSDQPFELADICRVKELAELFFNQNYNEKGSVTLNERVILEITMDDGLRLLGNFFDFNSNRPNGVSEFSSFQLRAQGELSSVKNVSESEYATMISPVKKYTFKSGTEGKFATPKALRFPFGENLLALLQGNAKLRMEVKELFDLYELKLFLDPSAKSINFFKELSDGTAIKVPYHQIADTLQRLIFYKAAILTNSQKVILFEEPEAHMFPPYIRKFTSEVMFDEGKNQYFIATHSPYVLESFVEDAFEDTSIYLVDYKNGETRINKLELEELNEIRQYGVDLFFNLESYLKKRNVDDGTVGNA